MSPVKNNGVMKTGQALTIWIFLGTLIKDLVGVIVGKTWCRPREKYDTCLLDGMRWNKHNRGDGLLRMEGENITVIRKLWRENRLIPMVGIGKHPLDSTGKSERRKSQGITGEIILWTRPSKGVRMFAERNIQIFKIKGHELKLKYKINITFQ